MAYAYYEKIARINLTTGEIKVEKKVDGDVVITVDGKDDAGNDIKGTFRGTVSELENQGIIKQALREKGPYNNVNSPTKWG